MRRALPAVLLLCVLLAAACGRDAKLAGSYEAEGPGGRDAPVVLLLRSDGRGSLSFNGEDTPLRWSAPAAGGEILLHTREGGVVRARVTRQGRLEMALPGAGELSFWKTGSE